MRIAIVITREGRISETFISDYLDVLKEFGHEVFLLPLLGPRTAIWAERHADADAMESGAKSSHQCSCYELVATSFPMLAVRLMATLPGLCETLRDIQPDIIHAHYLTPSGALCVEGKARGLLGSIPVVVSLHGVDVFKHGRSAPSAAAWCCTHADSVVYNSPEAAKSLKEWGVAEQSMHYVRRGVLLTKFPRPIGTRSNPSRILAVGRLVPKKGFDTLIEAFARVRASWPSSLTLRILGEGPERGRLQILAKAMHLASSIEFLGEFPNHRVLHEMRLADVFCLLCRRTQDGDMDGAPNVIQEAQYLRLPVVSTRISGIPGVVQAGKTAILVPPEDPVAASDAILQLLRDRDLRTTMGSAGRKFIRCNLSMHRNVLQAMMPIFSELVASTRNPAWPHERATP
jgi:glycosyltransferase involved in cell wall biosynthesis